MGRLLRLEYGGHFRTYANCEGVLQSKRRRDDTYSSGQRWVNTGPNHGLLGLAGASVRICGAYTAYVANALAERTTKRERERWNNGGTLEGCVHGRRTQQRNLVGGSMADIRGRQAEAHQFPIRFSACSSILGDSTQRDMPRSPDR